MTPEQISSLATIALLAVGSYLSAVLIAHVMDVWGIPERDE